MTIDKKVRKVLNRKFVTQSYYISAENVDALKRMARHYKVNKSELINLIIFKNALQWQRKMSKQQKSK